MAELGTELMFNFVKLLITIDASMILAIATLVEKVFDNGKFQDKKLIYFSFLSIFLSIFSGLLFLARFSEWVFLDLETFPGEILAILFYSSIITFIIAISAIMIFSISYWSRTNKAN